MFDENSIVRCVAKGLSKFTEGNLYRIVSKDFEHSEGNFYGIVDDAGLIHYFNEEDVQKFFTDTDVPNEITYFSNAGTSACTSFDIRDNVNHPSHYTWLKDLCGIEPIDICKHLVLFHLPWFRQVKNTLSNLLGSSCLSTPFSALNKYGTLA